MMRRRLLVPVLLLPVAALSAQGVITPRAARDFVDYFDRAQPVRNPAPARRIIQPAGYKPTPSPLVPGILVGDTLYLSGSTGGDPVTGQLVPGGLEPEMKQIMNNVQTVLAAADMSLNDVVAVTVYLADMADFARFNQLYTSYFPSGAYPTRSTVAVKELARGARLEITMTAVRSK
jgi:2-iminobutanoate/2-iminopropanoate deaminase